MLINLFNQFSEFFQKYLFYQNHFIFFIKIANINQ
jgi:hypothetical protein